jgi:hypothetical protein
MFYEETSESIRKTICKYPEESFKGICFGYKDPFPEGERKRADRKAILKPIPIILEGCQVFLI